MTEYFTSIAGPTFGPILTWVALGIFILVALWVLVLVIRRFRSGLYVSGGGKGRQPRLAVTDAVPIDSTRRLILVRRDDTEHLIMIGGPSDIVVEAGIGKPLPIAVQPRMPVQTIQTQQTPQPAPQPAPTQRPAVQAARDALADAERGRAVRVPETQVPERRVEPAAPPPTSPAATPVSAAPVVAPPAFRPASPPTVTQTVPTSRPDPNLDLDKLLDELRPNQVQDRQ